ncbi:MAG TPA: glycosyltransferase [Candidatus Atribacteria bacterium]|nr:glycosyltransferase [Candidatus Atribacteria bacterium]
MNVAIINLITRTPLERKKAPKVNSNRDAMIVKFARELQIQGIDLDLYISDAYKPINEEKMDVNVIYLPTRLKFIFWPSCLPFTPTLFNKLRNKYDVVICSESFQWSTVFAVLAKIFSFKKKMKIIVWQEMAKYQRLFKKILSLIFYKVGLRFFLDKYIDKYIPRSQLAKKFLLKQNIEEKKITQSIPHGVDQNVFYYDPNIKKENYIFSPSRLVHSKGVDVLLKAFAIVSKKIKNIELIIQGEGPKYEEYKALSKKLNIESKVKFCTERLNHTQMRIRYQKALVTVISSRSDNVTFSDMESIVCGTPVIISNGADSHINFLDGKGGMIFNSEDWSQLSDLLLKIIRDTSFRKHKEKETLEKSKLYFNSYLSKLFMKVILDVSNK